MALRIETHISGDVVILYCSGRLVCGDEAAAFHELVKLVLLGTPQILGAAG
jgi:hypothetical protein